MLTGKLKVVFISAALLLAAAGISADNSVPSVYTGNMRLAGMAGAYTAVADDQNSLLFNPAGLGTIRSSKLGIILHYTDRFCEVSDIPFNAPSVIPQFFFVAPGWGANISSAFHLKHSENSEDGVYSILKVNEVDVGFGLNLGMFSAGASLHASKISKAAGTVTLDPSSGDFLMDFFQQVLLNEGYEPIGDSGESESVYLRAGLLFDTGIFSFGAHHGSIFDIMAWSDQQELPELSELLNELNLGVSLRNPRLNRYGVRNLLRFRGAVDLHHVGCDENRMLRVGAEAGLHITETNRITLRAGYQEHMPELKDLLFGAVTPANGIMSFGAGIDLVMISVHGYAEVPGKILTNDETAEKPRFGFSAGLSF